MTLRRKIPPRIVLGIGGAIFAAALAVAFYHSPRHFSLDYLRARSAFDAGVRFDKEGKIESAIERYDRAIALDPDLTGAYNNRGSDRRRQADLEGAIADYGEVVRLRPDSEAGYYNRAVTREMKGDLDAALADFAAAVRLAQARVEWLRRHRSGGVNYAELTTLMDAEAVLVDCHLAHGRLRAEKGEFDRAAAEFTAAAGFKNTFGMTAGPFERARVRLLQGDFAAARSEIDAFVQAEPNNAGGFMLRGFLALFQADDPAAAAADFAQALRLGFEYRGSRGVLDYAFPTPDGRGPWLAYGVRFLPAAHYLLVWQHIARQRAGEDDAKEMAENLKQLGQALGHADLLVGTVSKEGLARSLARWPGPLVPMFLRTATPEAARAAAEQGANPAERRRRLCDVDFYTGLLRLKPAPAEARALLQAAVDGCPPGALEAVAAKLELARFGS